MLHLVTGTPGTGKTAFVVTTLDKIEKKNKVNLLKNKQKYIDNIKLIKKYDLQDEFTYIDFETGTGHTLKRSIKILKDDYFDIFQQDFDDLRPDDYFKLSSEYNQILERIVEKYSIKGFLALSPVRTIYTNINNLKIDYVRDNVLDWRDCPDGSIIVIDEVQLVSPYDDLKDRNNPIIQDLTIHRHRGFDFYFLTQAPVLLHSTVKALIGVHYHLTKPYGFKTVVYQWGSTRDYPNTMVNKLNRERSFDFSPPKYIYKLYKSTTINTHKKRLPYKMIVTLSLFVLAGFYVIYLNLSNVNNSSLVNDDKEMLAFDNKQFDSDKQKSNHMINDNTQAINIKSETQSDIDKLNQEIQKIQLEQQLAQLKQQSQPANVISFGGKCKTYSQSGQHIPMPLDECMQYANGEKPLFKQSVDSQFMANNYWFIVSHWVILIIVIRGRLCNI